jgi:hypothetical protein
MSSSTAPQRVTRFQNRQSSVEDSGLPAKETQKETSQQNAPPKPTQELGKRPLEAVNDLIDRRDEAAAGSKKDIRAAKKKSPISDAFASPSSPIVFRNVSQKSKQTNDNQSDVSSQQKQTSPDHAAKDSHASHAAMQDNAENRMIDDDHQSNGSSEAEMIYHAKQQQLFSLVIEIPTSSDYTNGKIIKFLKQTRDFLIADPELGPDIRHVSEILPKFQKINKDLESRDDNPNRQQQKRQTIGYRLIINIALYETVEKIKELSFEFESKDYVFNVYVSVKEQRQKQNESSHSRSVQVYNASLDILTSLIKPFLRRYGELEENGVYASRKNPYQPNKQVFYATFKEAASAEKFYSNPILWVYNEMLYVTPLELSLEKRQERREFCAKLNGLPPNANAREYQEFIEEFNVFEFRIPRNTRTNRTQLYAYVYFKDEESMSYAMERVIVRRNK